MTGDRLIITEGTDGFYAKAIPADVRFLEAINRETRRNRIRMEKQQADAMKNQTEANARRARYLAKREARHKALVSAFKSAMVHTTAWAFGCTVLIKLVYIDAMAWWVAAALTAVWAIHAGCKIGRLLQLLR